jgi:predicted ATPase
MSRGLEALQTLPDSPERDRRELAYQIALGTPLIAVHGYSAPQTGAAYSRARVLCERLGEAEPLVATLSGEFVFHFVRGNYPMIRRLTDEARQVSERFPNPVVRLAGHRLAGITAMHFGAFSEARSEFEAILRLYDASRHRSSRPSRQVLGTLRYNERRGSGVTRARYSNEPLLRFTGGSLKVSPVLL